MFMRIAAPVAGALPLAELRSLIATVLLGAWLLARRSPLGLRGRWLPLTVAVVDTGAGPFAAFVDQLHVTYEPLALQLTDGACGVV